MKVKIKKLSPDAVIPAYATANSAGCDLYSIETKVLRPGARALFKTGIAIELEPGYEAQVRPRSGLALKKGITVLNTPGTIDADYRGEVGVILINNGIEQQTVEKGERIAQMIIAKHEVADFELVAELGETERGEGGFGHTGNK